MSYGTNKQQSAWINIVCPHTLNVWDHYVATYDAGIMNLYKNGVFQSTGTFTYTNVSSANLPMYIGKGINGGFFLGAIDDVGIWGRALSQQEINDVYTNTVTSTKTLSTAMNYFVSPNVASDFLYLSTSSNNVSQISYTIYDTKGTIVNSGKANGNNHLIQIENLSKGVYFINIEDELNTKLKFIKL
jgi:hypothetical protein